MGKEKINSLHLDLREEGDQCVECIHVFDRNHKWKIGPTSHIDFYSWIKEATSIEKEMLLIIY